MDKNTSQPEMTGQKMNKKKEGLMEKVGDSIERVGQKVTEMGATSLGRAIYKAGDKIEHSRDEKDETH